MKEATTIDCVPDDGISQLTEECFQENTLDFVGDKQWVIYPDDDFRTEVVAQRTREGTYPPGSQWTQDPLKHSDGIKQGHVIDIVEVPADLEQGEYILSFRWDCKRTPQVWNVCANVEIL